ncbi:MAG: hypothetical protein GX892_01805 [Thermoanaerobacteraceae bacterium]|nr:hypothetical protein [Thermoanaerobacteraceae bacterium]
MGLNQIYKNNGNNDTKVVKNTSFLLKVKYYQNHSIQGTIQWIEKRKTVCFRSLMELILLLKEAAFGNIEARTWDGYEGLIEEVVRVNRPTGSDSRGGNP